MKSTRRHESILTARSEIPEPRRGARWRWSTPRKALAAGGALATVASLGATGAAAATAASGSSTTAGPRGQSPSGAAQPTVLGRITALRGSTITVQTRSKTATTVLYSPATTFKTLSGPGGTSSASSSSALKVGAFIGALGTKNSDGSVTASSIMIGTGPPPTPAGGTRPPRRAVGRFP